MIELPGPDPKTLLALLGKIPPIVSGGRIIVFSHGWAIDVWAFGKAHYYRLDGPKNARAICGHSTIHTSQLWGAGTYPRCKMCSKKARPK